MLLVQAPWHCLKLSDRKNDHLIIDYLLGFEVFAGRGLCQMAADLQSVAIVTY
jgi:hypothetical protein